VDKTVRVVRGSTGMIKRISAAVVLNHLTTTDAKGKTTTAAMSDAQLEKMTALVRETIGFSKDRGDSVNVVTAPFTVRKGGGGARALGRTGRRCHSDDVSGRGRGGRGVQAFVAQRGAKAGRGHCQDQAITRERVDEVVDKFTGVAAAQSLLVSDIRATMCARCSSVRWATTRPALLIDRILQGGDVSGIESLKWMDPLSVAELLRNEHPQIVAAILVHLDFRPGRGRAEVLHRAPAQRGDAARGHLEGIQPTALKDLNEVLFKVLAGWRQDAQVVAGRRQDGGRDDQPDGPASKAR
jgi:hypothetical protein